MNSEDDPSDNRENERMNTIRQYNLQIYDRYDVDGFYNMPVIHNDGFIPNQMIGFNYAMTASDFETGIHFFVDDYPFERYGTARNNISTCLGSFSTCSRQISACTWICRWR